ncbi:uncharacterized protein M421DRAFT_416226 [Didymella exigua CBS 183.55]|uniref:Ribonuclease H2 subunit B n=1 Tax=Didymella exigua CBS 183.55 TaxID=1150837 RepID=A0A6A5RXM9_9PLEO|nr:uncharacterized protein M421DRAFT_416226 [Didymella exigua CBS 183.55]KAF1932602.1 hypothetical protein M421DRAFT_416226 [Didymella exigua CBS 183.55]
MARATRAKPAPKEPTPEPAPSVATRLPEATRNPPKLFILPKHTSKDARIVTLDNPATSTPSRYFFCPSTGFYEFTRIAAPKKACRSWLMTRDDATPVAHNEPSESPQAHATNEDPETGLGSGFTTKDASLFLATPIDLLFLILPALAPQSARAETQHFLALDDYTDKLGAVSRHWSTLLGHHPALKTTLQEKMRTVCDTVDAGDETMYRLSHARLQAVLMQKAERMVRHGLPASMEEKLIKSALDAPVLSIQRSGESEDSTVDDAAAQDPGLNAPITHLLRLRTALTYLTTSYLPPSLTSPITTLLSTLPLFHPLTAHLSTLAALRATALAQRSISDNTSRKRAVEMDEELVAEREEKKRRKEEEAARKKGESLGVKKLRKVDTSGMRKMSAFFNVKPKTT